MQLTKKHFEEIAEILKKYKANINENVINAKCSVTHFYFCETCFNVLVDNLAYFLEKQNEKFDKDKFKQAVFS